MLHSLSLGEWALIFGIVLILFGGNRIASVGKALGEGIANFKKGLRSIEEEPVHTPHTMTRVQPESLSAGGISQKSSVVQPLPHTVEEVSK